MSESKTELVEDMLTERGFGFCVRWRCLPHWADVEAYEYITACDDGAKEFNRKDWDA